MILDVVRFLAVLLAVIVGWALAGWVMFWLAAKVRRKQRKEDSDGWWPWGD